MKATRFIGVDAGFLGGPLGGVGLDKVTQGVEVLKPEVDELFIIELIFDNLVNDSQIEGVIGSRSDQEETTGMGGRLGGPDIDDREFAAIGQGAHQVIALLDVDGLEHVPSLKNDMFGVLKIITHSLAAKTEERHGGMHNITGARGVVITPIRRSQATHEGLVQVQERTAPIREEHRARTIFRHDFF